MKNYDEERFLNRLVETENGCLELPTASSSGGYTQIKTNWRRGQLAHRVAVEIATGEPVPEDLTIDHLCFNRRCCNVRHMEVVTRGENNRRKTTTVLSALEADEIRIAYATGEYTQQQLANEYGISRGHISKIVRNVNWRAA